MRVVCGVKKIKINVRNIWKIVFWFIIFENINHINDSEVDKITHRCTYITCTYVQNVSLNDTKHNTKSEWNGIRKINLCVRVLLCTSALYYFCVNPELSFKVFNTTRLRTPLLCLSVRPSVCVSVCPSVWLSVCLSAHLCACLSVRLSDYPSVGPSIRLSVCLPIQLSLSLSFLLSIVLSFFFYFLLHHTISS